LDSRCHDLAVIILEFSLVYYLQQTIINRH